jgi:hypothetical protein
MKENDWLSKIDEAKGSALRLRKANAAAKAANEKHDTELYEYLTKVNRSCIKLAKPGPAEAKREAKKLAKMLTQTEKPSFKTPEHFFLSITCPDLPTQRRTKYANVLWLVRHKKKGMISLKNFVRENGGINGCDERGAAARTAARAADKAERAAKKPSARKGLGMMRSKTFSKKAKK